MSRIPSGSLTAVVLSALLAFYSEAAPPGVSEGTARDLTGVWTAEDGARLALRHVAGGRHEASFRPPHSPEDAFRLHVDDAEPGRAASVFFSRGGEASSGVVSRNRTTLRWKGREYSRAVAQGRVRLNVLTYNVEGQTAWESLGKIAEFIRREAPDVVALEEIKTRWHVNQAEVIAQAAGYRLAWGSDRRAPEADEGEAILVRGRSQEGLILLEHVSLPLPAPEATGVDAKRQALFVTLGAGGGRTVQIVATHLSLNEHARQVQAAALARKIHPPAILLGDLNDDTIAVFGLTDVFKAANPGRPGFTWPAYAPTTAPDKILMGGGRVLASWVVGKPKALASGTSDDHLPVEAVVELAAP